MKDNKNKIIFIYQKIQVKKQLKRNYVKILI